MHQPHEPLISEEARAAWRDWLRTKKWDYWITATFAHVPDQYTVERVARSWVAGFGERVYAALAVECGKLEGRLHTHLLIGGLGAHPDWPLALSRRWLWGDIRVSHYNPDLDPRDTSRGACAYISKHPEGIELLGTPRKWRPRVPRD